MLNIKFQISEHSYSEKGDFLISYVFLRFEPRIPWCRAILDPGTLNKLGKRQLGMQCVIPNFKHLSQAILKKKISE